MYRKHYEDAQNPEKSSGSPGTCQGKTCQEKFGRMYRT